MKYLFFFLLFLFSLVTQASAQSTWVIPAFNSTLAIQSDGNVLVIEKIDVDFKDLEKHGIYRDIPVVYEDETAKKTYTKIVVQSVKQDEQNAEYKLIDEEKNLRIRIGNPDKTISGKHTYEIIYTAVGILRSFQDHDELYWNVTGNDWEANIEKATATVTIPKNTIEKFTCFEGYQGSTGLCTAKQQNNTTVHFSNSDMLTSGEGVTIVVGFTKGTVPILTVESPKRLEDDLFTMPSLMGFLLALIIGIGGIIWVWMKHGRDMWFKTRSILDPDVRSAIMPVGAKETTVVEFEPPEHLRPAEIGVLMDQRADTLDVSATIIDLANRCRYFSAPLINNLYPFAR